MSDLHMKGSEDCRPRHVRIVLKIYCVRGECGGSNRISVQYFPEVTLGD